MMEEAQRKNWISSLHWEYVFFIFKSMLSNDSMMLNSQSQETPMRRQRPDLPSFNDCNFKPQPKLFVNKTTKGTSSRIAVSMMPLDS